jgi:hypothetical protein
MIHIEHLIRTDEYCLTDDEGRKIYVAVENGHLITLNRGQREQRGDCCFKFIKSTPEVVKAIGEMFVEASKLVEDKKC